MRKNSVTTNKLAKLVKASKRNELACRECLIDVKYILFPGPCKSYIFDNIESRGFYGISDLEITGEINDASGSVYNSIMVWEIKAPQCYIFEKDRNNRLRPSKDLYSAENQLIHYVHDIKGSDEHKSKFGITSSDYVTFGGIIIGRKENLVKGVADCIEAQQLYDTAIRIRNAYFYKPNNIRIITWDYILDQYSRHTTSNAVKRPRKGKSRKSQINVFQAESLKDGVGMNKQFKLYKAQ